MIHFLARASSSLHSQEDGQTMIEYALILSLVSIAAIALLSVIGSYPSSVFSHINSDF